MAGARGLVHSHGLERAAWRGLWGQVGSTVLGSPRKQQFIRVAGVGCCADGLQKLERSGVSLGWFTVFSLSTHTYLCPV